TLPKAVITTNTASEADSRACLRKVMPSMLGMGTSVRTTAGENVPSFSSASAPSCASSTSKPSSVSRVFNAARALVSSSTTRIRSGDMGFQIANHVLTPDGGVRRRFCARPCLAAAARNFCAQPPPVALNVNVNLNLNRMERGLLRAISRTTHPARTLNDPTDGERAHAAAASRCRAAPRAHLHLAQARLPGGELRLRG